MDLAPEIWFQDIQRKTLVNLIVSYFTLTAFNSEIILKKHDTGNSGN